jgi:exonuclease SbcC
VVFALYGHVPGVRGGAGARHRSDHAAPDLPTEVELEATLRGTRVRIVRRPRQERPKLRGGGTTRSSTASGCGRGRGRLGGGARPPPRRGGPRARPAARHDPRPVLPGRPAPAGRVRRLPAASSDGRATSSSGCSPRSGSRRPSTGSPGQAKAAEREYFEALDAARGSPPAWRRRPAAEPPQDWERDPAALGAWVGELTVPAAAEEATAQAVRHSTRAARAAAEQVLAAARELSARQARAAAAREQLVAWEAGRPARDAADAEREAASRAAAVAALLHEAQERAAARAAAQAAAERARTALAGDDDLLAGLGAAEPPAPAGPATPATPAPAGTPAAPARPAVAEGQLSLDAAFGVDTGAAAVPAPPAPDADDEPAILRDEAGRLRARAGAVAALAPIERGVAAAARALAEQEAELGRARRELAEAVAATRAAPEALARAEAAVRAAREARAQEAGLARAVRQARARAEAGARRDALAGPLRDAERAERAAAAAELDARRGWLDVRERRVAGMAAHLAAALEPGAPCPVCGAMEHPDPARPDPGAGPGAGEAEEVAAQRDQEAAAAAQAAAAATLARIRADLAGAVAVAGHGPLDELRTELSAATARHAAAVRAASGLAAAEARLGRATKAHAGAGAAREAAATAVAGLDAACASARATLDADRAALAAALGGAPDVATRVAALTAAADLRVSAAEAIDAGVRAAREAGRATARADAAGRAHGFGDAAAARAAVRDADHIASLADHVRAFDAGLAERRALARDPDLVAAAAAAAPDLPALEAVWHEADAAAAAAEGAAALASRRARELQELDGQVESALDVLAPLGDRRRAVRDLSRLADGSAEANNLRMRLSAYVLAARLEEVAAAATVRLAAMSGGRYTLVHCDEGARGRQRGGLDLRVVDSWTGRERAPATLSGGETFFASLALALGSPTSSPRRPAAPGWRRCSSTRASARWTPTRSSTSSRSWTACVTAAAPSASCPTSPTCATASPRSCTWSRSARARGWSSWRPHEFRRRPASPRVRHHCEALTIAPMRSSLASQSPPWMAASCHRVPSWMTAPVQSTSGKASQSTSPSSRPPAGPSTSARDASPATTADSTRLRRSSTPTFHLGIASSAAPAPRAAASCEPNAAVPGAAQDEGRDRGGRHREDVEVRHRRHRARAACAARRDARATGP